MADSPSRWFIVVESSATFMSPNLQYNKSISYSLLSNSSELHCCSTAPTTTTRVYRFNRSISKWNRWRTRRRYMFCKFKWSLAGGPSSVLSKISSLFLVERPKTRYIKPGRDTLPMPIAKTTNGKNRSTKRRQKVKQKRKTRRNYKLQIDQNENGESTVDGRNAPHGSQPHATPYIIYPSSSPIRSQLCSVIIN